jgi:hypothetical protein
MPLLQYAAAFTHRCKLHNAVALGVEACGLQIKSHQRSRKLQAAWSMSDREGLPENVW